MTEKKENVVELTGQRKRSQLALNAGPKVVELPRVCPACDGRRRSAECYHCNGRGRV